MNKYCRLRLKMLVCTAIVAFGFTVPDALAILVWSWEFAPPITVGPTDVVTIKATIHNDASSTLNIVGGGGGIFESDSVSPGLNVLYTFEMKGFGLGLGGDGPVITPGQSFTFTFGTLSPNVPLVPPGTYSGQGTVTACRD